MSFSQAFIIQKIEQMKGYLNEAGPILALDEQEILSDTRNLHTLERLLQLIVDTALDINKHFIKELGLEVSDDLQGTFIALGENKILPEDFAEKIAPVVGLRNRLVHRYEKIDSKRFIKDFKNNQNDFLAFMKHIIDYLDKQSSQSEPAEQK